jgi:hypothetical protein
VDDTVAELVLDDRPRGPRRPMTGEYSRDLVTSDLAALADRPAGQVVRPVTLARLHSSHHAVAKCLALGMKDVQTAAVTGYTTNRISALKRDDLFKALVAEYTDEAKSFAGDMVQRMANVSMDALELLHDRLLEKPEEFSVGMLLDVVKALADRTGHGPNQQVNLNLSVNSVDRPPRETAEEWNARRARELTADDIVGSSAGTSDGRDHRRLVS